MDNNTNTQKRKLKIKEQFDVPKKGGIRAKVMKLIVISLIAFSLTFILMSLLQSHMLSKMASDSSTKQEKAISRTSSGIMSKVATENLERLNVMEVSIADEMFELTKDHMTYLAKDAKRMIDNPEDYGYSSYSSPDPADDGKWTAKVIYADGVDPNSSAVRSKLGLISNMTDEMVDLCTSCNVANAYIGLPEGAHFSVSDSSSSWFEKGKIKSYDPRTREWYKKAKAEKKLVFTDGEWDANTGAYCIECAIPVYDSNNKLQAVIGTDMYLDDMQKVMNDASTNGEYYLIVNHSGVAVMDPVKDIFPLSKADKSGDIRKSKNKALAKIAKDALKGKTVPVQLVKLKGDMYYVMARPIKTTGWFLISAYSQKAIDKAAVQLKGDLESIQKDTRSTYQKQITVFRVGLLCMILLFMVVILFAASVLGKRIVDPLNTITERISELGESNLEFKMEDEYRTGDEVEELAESFASLSHKTIEYMDEVVSITAEKERIGTELALATQIQTSMLPHIFPAFPNRTEFDIYASMDPAKEVGGDFYDFFLINENQLCLLIADVSGKGIPASLFMMSSKIVLQSIAIMGYSPKEILEKTNEALVMNNEAEMFVTVWLGILDLPSGKLTAANAGHEYPVIKKPDGQFELYHDKHGLVLGGMEGLKYKEYELTLEKGSKLFVYTDGVPEATNAEKEMFGTERTVEALNLDPDAPPDELMKNVRKAVDDFVKDAEQFDDLTMLCIQYNGPAEGQNVV